MIQKNKFLQKLFFFSVLLTGFIFQSPVAFADTYCSCTSSTGDCHTIAVLGKTATCAVVDCKAKYGADFKTPPAADPSGALKDTCSVTHNTFAASERAKLDAASTTPRQFITPILNVEIPNLKFTDAFIGTCSSGGEGQCIKSSFLAQYINAIYLWMIGAGITIAIVMIMISGLQYVLGAGGGEAAKSAKKRMGDAVIGLVLLLSITLILNTINPQLSILKMVEVQNVELVDLPEMTEEMQVVEDESPEEEARPQGAGIVGEMPNVGQKQKKYAAPNPLPTIPPPTKAGGTQDTFVNPTPRQCIKPSVPGVSATYPGLTINTKFFGSLDCNVSGRTMTSKRSPSSINMVILHEGGKGDSVSSLPSMWVGQYLYGKVVECKQNKDLSWSYDWCKQVGFFTLPPTVHQTPIGSHYALTSDGTFYQLADEGYIMNHCCAENNISIGIDLAYSGNSPNDKWTEAQYQSLAKFIKGASAKYGFAISDSSVRGHCELGSHTDPPHFDLKHLGDLLGFKFNLAAHSKISKTGADQCNWTPL